VVRRFAAGGPTVAVPERLVELPDGPAGFYRDPAANARGLYAAFGALGDAPGG
jgi:hypothetical protein